MRNIVCDDIEMYITSFFSFIGFTFNSHVELAAIKHGPQGLRITSDLSTFHVSLDSISSKFLTKKKIVEINIYIQLYQEWKTHVDSFSNVKQASSAWLVKRTGHKPQNECLNPPIPRQWVNGPARDPFFKKKSYFFNVGAFQNLMLGHIIPTQRLKQMQSQRQRARRD